MLLTVDSHFCSILCCSLLTMFRYGSLPESRCDCDRTHSLYTQFKLSVLLKFIGLSYTFLAARQKPRICGRFSNWQRIGISESGIRLSSTANGAVSFTRHSLSSLLLHNEWSWTTSVSSTPLCPTSRTLAAFHLIPLLVGLLVHSYSLASCSRSRLQLLSL